VTTAIVAGSSRDALPGDVLDPLLDAGLELGEGEVETRARRSDAAALRKPGSKRSARRSSTERGEQRHWPVVTRLDDDRRGSSQEVHCAA
jgi:hypothetical protein